MEGVGVILSVVSIEPGHRIVLADDEDGPVTLTTLPVHALGLVRRETGAALEPLVLHPDRMNFVPAWEADGYFVGMIRPDEDPELLRENAEEMLASLEVEAIAEAIRH